MTYMQPENDIIVFIIIASICYLHLSKCEKLGIFIYFLEVVVVIDTESEQGTQWSHQIAWGPMHMSDQYLNLDF